MIRMKLTGRMDFSSDTHPLQKVVTGLGAVEFTISVKGDGSTRLTVRPPKEQKFNKHMDCSPPFLTSDLIGAIDEAIADNWGLWEMFATRTLKDYWKHQSKVEDWVNPNFEEVA
jgi:hypothetical protein